MLMLRYTYYGAKKVLFEHDFVSVDNIVLSMENKCIEKKCKHFILCIKLVITWSYANKHVFKSIAMRKFKWRDINFVGRILV